VSLVKAIFAMGPIGNVLCIAIIIGLFARNLMGPTSVSRGAGRNSSSPPHRDDAAGRFLHCATDDVLALRC
jgi:hypothetical protein